MQKAAEPCREGQAKDSGHLQVFREVITESATKPADTASHRSLTSSESARSKSTSYTPDGLGRKNSGKSKGPVKSLSNRQNAMLLATAREQKGNLEPGSSKSLNPNSSKSLKPGKTNGPRSIVDRENQALEVYNNETRSFLQRKCAECVLSSKFDQFMSFVVTMNCLSMGLESEVPTSDEWTSGLYILDMIFLGIFTAEVILVGYGCGLGSFRSPQGVLDITIVVTGWLFEIILPIALEASGGNSAEGLHIMQMVKMFKALRAIRVLRVLTMFDALWLTVQSFTFCLQPLAWTVLFILMIIYLFAIFAVGLIGQNDEAFGDHMGEEDLNIVQARFSTTVSSMVCLFQIMTLDEWFAIVSPLLTAAPWTYAFFIPYIAVCSLALMNLVTAVVVESSMRRHTPENEAEFEQKSFETQVEATVAEMLDIFHKFDEDGSGELDAKEFVNNAPRSPQIMQIMSVLGYISPEEQEHVQSGNLDDVLQSFFKILSDDSNTMNTQKFMESLLKLERVCGDRNWVAAILCSEDPKQRAVRTRKAIAEEPQLVNQLHEFHESFYGNVDYRVKQLENWTQAFFSEAMNSITHLEEQILSLKMMDRQTKSDSLSYSPEQSTSTAHPIRESLQTVTELDEELLPNRFSETSVEENPPGTPPSEVKKIVSVEVWQKLLMDLRSVGIDMTMSELKALRKNPEIEDCGTESPAVVSATSQSIDTSVTVQGSGFSDNTQQEAAVQKHPFAPSLQPAESSAQAPRHPQVDDGTTHSQQLQRACIQNALLEICGPDTTQSRLRPQSAHQIGRDVSLLFSPSRPQSACQLGRDVSFSSLFDIRSCSVVPDEEELSRARDDALALTSKKLPPGSYARWTTLHQDTWRILRKGNAGNEIRKQLLDAMGCSDLTQLPPCWEPQLLS
eukprot:gnl/MRDRNA2_/MRDRNA2_59402_c0_seq2.p1 gnl/MRDRNA2_/MRDRNA2_59402_c0~~gnl/MRDRNA2_/MRDRNA2_59402_c0_seq2.p1  ORF type:complete len:903 (+),score=151.51 gnl/MRDRNA2_/MRDRNA2_59402_c0_seq2:146-2854(+)